MMGSNQKQATHTASRRLFFALWPSHHEQQAIESKMRPHVEASRGRAIPTRNLHVTLAFLGEVPESRLEVVKTCAATIVGIHPFDLRFDRIEVWARAHVLCLAMHRVPDVLLQLFEQLRFNLLNEHFEIRQEEYRPHVTLARDVRRRDKEETIAPIGWRVTEFVLMQSQRGASGSEYSVMERWALK